MTGTHTIASGTTLTAGYTIGATAGPNVTLTNFGGVGTTSTLYGVKDLSAGNTVVNAGVILANTISGEGVGLRFGGSVTNQPGGTIRAALGVYVGANGGTVENFGQITGVATGYGTGAVRLKGGGTIVNAASGVINGYYGITAAGAAVSVTNQGSISGSLGGVFLRGGGSVSQAAGGTIASSYAVEIKTGIGLVTNDGVIKGQKLGVELATGGTVVNGAGGLIAGLSSFGVRVLGGAGTVRNSGTISSSVGTAVAFAAGYANQLALYPGSVLAGAVNGGNIAGGTAVSTLELSSGASIGTIAGIGGTISGFGRLLVANGASWVVTKDDVAAGSQVIDLGTLASSGDIFATVTVGSGGVFDNAFSSTVSGSGYGVLGLPGNDSVANGGLITGGSGHSAVGLEGGGSVTNLSSGTISGLYGVLISGGAGTVINSGSIAGGQDAVLLAAGYDNRLILYPGARFSGLVLGGNTVGATAVSTMELAGTTEGTIGGLGTTFSGFQAVRVDAGSAWDIAGQESIAAGMTLANLGTLAIDGTLSLDGTLSQSGLIQVGQSGDGALLIQNQGSVLDQSPPAATIGMEIGLDAGFSGEVTVTGTGSVLNNAGLFVIGDEGAGSLSILDGARGVTSADTVDGVPAVVIGNTASAAGSSVDVAGQGSSLLVNGGDFDIGAAAEGSLDVAQGGAVSAPSLVAGVSSGASGIITLSDAGSDLTVSGTASIGGSGAGEVSILNGATMHVASDLDAGEVAGGSGTIDVEGASTLFIGGNLDIGAGGPATLIAGPDASVLFGDGGLNQGPDSVLDLYTSIDPLYSLGGTINIEGSQIETIPAYVAGTAFDLGGGINYVLNTPDIHDGAMFDIGASESSLTLNAASVGTGVTIGFAGNTGTLVLGIDTLATIETPASGLSGFSAEANSGLGTDLIGGFQGTVSDFIAGDTIVVDTSIAASFVALGSTQVAVMANSGTLGVIGFSSAAQASAALATPGALVDSIVPCFAAGTRILTARGDVAVEDLRKDDTVWSVLHRAFRPVVWIGHRVVDCARHPAPHKVWPVRIAAGALGPAQPVRDLYISPDHALYVDGALIPAKCLVNGETVRQIETGTIAYHHVELQRHDVLLAEGVAAESYLDTGDRAGFANGGAAMTLHPSWGDIWELEGCAPLVVRGPALLAVRERLSA